MIIQRDPKSYLTEESVNKVEHFMIHFQELMTKVFYDYQPSNCETVKFHFLAHWTDDIRFYGNLRMPEVRFYENRHLVYKEESRRTSGRDRLVHKETIERMDDRLGLQMLQKNVIMTMNKFTTGRLD